MPLKIKLRKKPLKIKLNRKKIKLKKTPKAPFKKRNRIA